jgi:hypothetical protein
LAEEVEDAHVGEEAGGRRMPVDGGDDLDWLVIRKRRVVRAESGRRSRGHKSEWRKKGHPY